ncbi:hypothetical protein VTJ04DRAFT_4933 [Mycothermus thermophilus]|uniref:uncharacterized protein n=1 Tax=Humicola insolens TaxID=85995 RepID=UPI003743AAF9
MPPPSATLVTRIKVQLKLSIARLRMVQKRDEALAKTQRRAMAQLLEQGKVDSARIRVENIIRSDIITELHEILELYCELLLARAGLLAPGTTPPPSSPSTNGQGQQQPQQPVCDPGLEEAVHSIIYAAPRTEIKELQQVRALLVERFGKEYALRAAENRDGKVSERVLRKLSVAPPKPELVQGYLEEIAKAYGVDWPPGRLQAKAEAAAAVAAAAEEEEEEEGDGPPDFEDGGDGGGGVGGGQKKLTELVLGDDDEVEAREELSKATPPKSFKPASPLQVNPPRPTTENIHPKVTLNKVELTPTKKTVAAAAKKPVKKTGGIADGIPEVDDLAKRFAALKR